MQRDTKGVQITQTNLDYLTQIVRVELGWVGFELHF